VCWSPDGTRLASASWDKTVRIWNGSTGKEEQRLEGHSSGVYSVSWSPDGTRLATASNDNTVRIWNGPLTYTDPPLKPSLMMSSARVTEIQQAAMAWRDGDVYRAWHTIGEVCQAPWVKEVLEALGFEEAGLEETGLEESVQTETATDPVVELADRASRVRAAIDKQVAADASDSDTIPPLEESLESLASFLDEAPDDDAITWLKESARHILESQQHSTDQPLRVALLGEFSSGKTRLINALLGEKILSTGIVPVTRSVTRIVHGDEISVTVRHVDGSEIDVGVDQLKAYTDERKKEEGSSEVDEVILRHPSPLLKKVELWDTPGFNSDNQLHDQVAAQLLLEADAVLWILSSHQIGTRSEGKLLETVRRAQGKVVAVLNQTDRLDDDQAITNQVAEVKKHYSETVEEVVATSAKWLEQDHPGGNREPLMSQIEAIGAWSQEQRKRRTARRVAAVAAQGLAYLDLANEEAKQIETQQQQHDKKLTAQHQQSLALWKEAIEHRDRLHDVRADEKDQWFKSHCAQRTPLTLAYRALLRDELSIEGYKALISCLHTLEETHWHLSPHDPVPWRDDFLLSWRKGMEGVETWQGEPLFHSDREQESPAASWLIKLTDIQKATFPTRWAGCKPSVKKILESLRSIPTAAELKKWWSGLNLTPSLYTSPAWVASMNVIRGSTPARDVLPWLELEEQVRAIVPTRQGPLLQLEKQQKSLQQLEVRCTQLKQSIEDEQRKTQKEYQEKFTRIQKEQREVNNSLGRLDTLDRYLEDPKLGNGGKAQKILKLVAPGIPIIISDVDKKSYLENNDPGVVGGLFASLFGGLIGGMLVKFVCKILISIFPDITQKSFSDFSDFPAFSGAMFFFASTVLGFFTTHSEKKSFLKETASASAEKRREMLVQEGLLEDVRTACGLNRQDQLDNAQQFEDTKEYAERAECWKRMPRLESDVRKAKEQFSFDIQDVKMAVFPE
jgi:predicted GTPase